MKGKILISLTFLLIGLLTLSSISPVLASTEVDIGAVQYLNSGDQVISGRYSNTVNRPQDRSLQTTSGKIIILDYPTQTSVNIKVYSASGVLEDTTSLPNNQLGGVEMAQYSSTQILIMYCGIGSGSHIHTYFYLFNFNTYSGTNYDANPSSYLPTVSGTETVDRIGQLYYYSGVWWGMVLYDSYYGGGQCIWSKFTVATLTASYNTQIAYTHDGYTSEIMSFQDSSNLNKVYVVASKAGSSASDQTTPQYYVFDMSTGVMTLLATNGINAVMPDGASNTYTQPYSNMITYMGGGIYNSGTYYYLYHAWVYSISPATSTPAPRFYKVVMWVGKFNNTITAGNLISQVCKTQSLMETSGATYTSAGSSWGYYIYTTLPQLKMKMVYNNFNLGKYMAMEDITVTDITAMHTSFDTLLGSYNADNIYITYKADNANLAKNPVKTWSYQENSVNSYLFLNESATIVSMSDTLAISPNDNPLIQAKSYVFTWTVYKNGIADLNNDTYRIYFDGTLSKTGVLDGLGHSVVSITSSLTGTHTLQLEIWNDTAHIRLYQGTLYSEVWAEVTSSGGTNPVSYITTGWFNLLVVWFPIFMFVVAPMLAVGFLGAKYGGGTGMFLGIIFGGFGGVVAGVQMLILDTYVLYLYILLIAIGLVFALSSRGNNNG